VQAATERSSGNAAQFDGSSQILRLSEAIFPSSFIEGYLRSTPTVENLSQQGKEPDCLLIIVAGSPQQSLKFCGI